MHSNDREHLDSRDVVYWSLRQTCQTTESMRPLWAMQGRDHHQRSQTCQTLFEGLDISEAVSDDMKVERFWEDIQEPEALSLSRMYGLDDGIVDPFLSFNGDDYISRRLVQVWRSLDVFSIRDSSMHEEQEREISHEVEREQQVQRPPPAKPLQHSLHPDVIHFAKHGVFPTTTTSFTSEFATMKQPSAGQLLDLNNCSISNIFVTGDFTDVVQNPKNSNRDEYMRPVN